jgi:hypothetical protein
MNQIHRSSSGCHVAHGDVAPETIVNDKSRWLDSRNGLIGRTRTFVVVVHRCLVATSHLACSCSIVVGRGRGWAVSHRYVCCRRHHCSSPGGQAVTNGGGGEEDSRWGKGRVLCLFGNRSEVNK